MPISSVTPINMFSNFCIFICVSSVSALGLVDVGPEGLVYNMDDIEASYGHWFEDPRFFLGKIYNHEHFFDSHPKHQKPGKKKEKTRTRSLHFYLSQMKSSANFPKENERFWMILPN